MLHIGIFATYMLLATKLGLADVVDGHPSHFKIHKSGPKEKPHAHNAQENPGPKTEGHKDDDHESSRSVGEGKAIVAVDEERGFKLSKEAVETLGIEYQEIDREEFEIPRESIVISKSLRGLYVFRNNFFKLIHVTILSESDVSYRVKTSEAKPGDHVVINGVDLLRVADIYSTDKSEYGHSH